MNAAAESSAPEIELLLGRHEKREAGQQVFRIGDLAREFGVTLRTLRFYEDRGLLNPKRVGNSRLYTRRDRTRLRIVLLLKMLGFSLTEARQLIELYDEPNGERLQLETALARLVRQRQLLKEQQRELEQSLYAMEETITAVEHRLRSLGDNGAPKKRQAEGLPASDN